jgi:TRAP-type C4-dicarboxylate transport system permease small subunit
LSALASIADRARQWSQLIALIGLTCLLFQATAIVADVMLRWIFNSPVFGMEDINQLLLAVILASFFPALLIESKNITIDFLGRALGHRAAAWFDVFGHLVTLILFTIVAWQLAVYAHEVRLQTTLILQLPVAPAWWLTAVLMALCVPVQALVLMAQIVVAVGDSHDTAAGLQER